MTYRVFHFRTSAVTSQFTDALVATLPVKSGRVEKQRENRRDEERLLKYETIFEDVGRLNSSVPHT